MALRAPTKFRWTSVGDGPDALDVFPLADGGRLYRYRNIGTMQNVEVEVDAGGDITVMVQDDFGRRRSSFTIPKFEED